MMNFAIWKTSQKSFLICWHFSIISRFLWQVVHEYSFNRYATPMFGSALACFTDIWDGNEIKCVYKLRSTSKNRQQHQKTCLKNDLDKSLELFVFEASKGQLNVTYSEQSDTHQCKAQGLSIYTFLALKLRIYVPKIFIWKRVQFS